MLKNIIRRRRFIPAIILVGIFALFIGATIAYDSDYFTADNVFNSEILAHTTEEFTPPDDWKTCQEIPKTVVTTNDKARRIKVRLSYDEYWKSTTDSSLMPMEKDGLRLALINFQNEYAWELKDDGWYYWKGELAPGESTVSLLKSVTLNCDANLSSNQICHELPNGTVDCDPADENEYDDAEYHLVVHVEITEDEFPMDKYYNIAVNPNQGKFNGSENVFMDRVVAGTNVDLSNISRNGHTFLGWTKNEDSELYTESNITINEDTTLVANWQNDLTHVVTVDPNGGVYHDSSEPQQFIVHKHDNFDIDEASRDDYAFDHWLDDEGNSIYGNVLEDVDRDITVQAIWSPIVARIERTQKLYPSIMAAEAEAINGDTITLLVDTAEVVTNEKTVTLDLNGHTVTGSLTNTESGNITLINGEINNPDGASVTNNGTLTMGINDFTDDGNVNILNDNIRLVGTTTGIDQNGVFNFYDGYLEGEVALDGGYNDSPLYRNTFDGVEVKYYPFVDFLAAKNLQHAELANTDRAVSKTINGGEIYYYNLQDNINTSVRTGFKIYVIRDFDASYNITSPADSDVTIDLVGWKVNMNYDVTINGKLTIEDSKTTRTTNPDTGKTTTDYAGLITVQKTIAINDELVLNNAKITNSSTLDLIQNNGTLTMHNSVLTTTTSYIVQPTAGAVYNLDDDSYFMSTSKPAVYNSSTDFVWTSGNIFTVNNYAIDNTNTANSKVTINGGNISSTSGTAIHNNRTSVDAVVINGGTIKAGYSAIMDKDTYYSYSSSATAISGYVTMNGGEIILVAPSTAASQIYGISAKKFKVTGGSINITGECTSRHYTCYDVTAYGIQGDHNNDYYDAFDNPHYAMTGGSINIDLYKASAVYGISAANGTVVFSGDASIKVKTDTGAATGISLGTWDISTAAISVDGGTIEAEGNGANSNNYGIYANSNYGTKRISGGTITAKSSVGSSYGLYHKYGTSTVTGGKIIGGTYGIYGYSGKTVTLGSDDGTISATSPEIIGGSYAIYNGTYNFYDGILRASGVAAHPDNIFAAIPDGATYTYGTEGAYPYNCWLSELDGYLEVAGQKYNALGNAYNAITGDTGTIKVVKDAEIEAALPDSPEGKNITFDLNGHELTYQNILRNYSNLTVIDSSEGKTGVLHNIRTTTIVNEGTLTISSGVVSSTTTAINNCTDSTLNINGGTVSGQRAIFYKGNATDSWNYDANACVAKDGTHQDTTINMTGGTIEATKAGIDVPTTTALTITGGKIKVTANTTDEAVGIKLDDNQSRTVINTSTEVINVSNTGGNATGHTGGSIALDDATITVDASANAIGVAVDVNAAEKYIAPSINNGKIYVNGGASAKGIDLEDWGTKMLTVDGNTIVDASSTGTAYGIYAKGAAKATINNITATASSVNGISYGIFSDEITSTTIRSQFYVNGGTITATSANSDSYGAYLYNATIKGGIIAGDTYGVYGYAGYDIIIGEKDHGLSITSPEIIGKSTNALANGVFYFYDGVLRSNGDAYEENSIRAIQGGTTYHHEASTDYTDNCWLIVADNYLEVAGTEYNDLEDAYNAITGSTGTIKVIASTTIEAMLPESPTDKTITFDLNGHQLNYKQPLINNSASFTITDSSQDESGILGNINKYAEATVINKTTLNVNAGTINGLVRAIYHPNKSSTLNISGGTVQNGLAVIENAASGTTINISGGTIKSNEETTRYGIKNAGNMTLNMSGDGKINLSLAGDPASGYIDRNAYSNIYSIHGVYSSSSAGVNINMSDTSSIMVACNDYNPQQSSSYLDDSDYTECHGVSFGNVTMSGSAKINVESNTSHAHGTYYTNITTTKNTTPEITAQASATAPAAVAVSNAPTVDINAGSFKAVSENTPATAILAQKGTIDSALVEAFSETNKSVGVTPETYVAGTLNINDTVIDVRGYTSTVGISSKAGTQAAVNKHPNIYLDNSRITAKSAQASYGIEISCNNVDSNKYDSYALLDIKDSSVDAQTDAGAGNDAAAYGIKMCNATNDHNHVESNIHHASVITADSETGTSYGAYVAKGSIKDTAKISGGTYGVYTVGAFETTIGADDSNISQTLPEISGGTYGIYGGRTKFYDGLLRGGTQAYKREAIVAIPDNANIVFDTETVGEGTETRTNELAYLDAEHYVAQIGDQKYTRLNYAVAAVADTGDTIELIDDNYIYSALTFPAGKNFTIDTNGHLLYSSYPITNMGTVKITNSQYSTSNPTINYIYTDELIFNYDNANLELEHLDISAISAIRNRGTLTVDNTSIAATETAIDNYATLNLSDSTISSNGNGIISIGTVTTSGSNTITSTYTNNTYTANGNHYAIYTKGGTATYDNITANQTVYAYAGTTNIANSTLANNTYLTIAASGTLSLDNSDLNWTKIGGTPISNSGTFNLTNLTYNIKPTGYDYPENITAISSTSGSVKLTNSSIVFDATNFTNRGTGYAIIKGIVSGNDTITLDSSTLNYRAGGYRAYTYGIDNTTGTVNIKNSSIVKSNDYGISNTSGNINFLSGTIEAGTGITNETGKVILGVAEDPSSPNYGKETADVSITDPSITASIGISNGTGIVEYYDGIITARTPFNKEPNVVEYMYEAIEHDGTDNMKYRVLEWMRQQPTNPTGN